MASRALCIVLLLCSAARAPADDGRMRILVSIPPQKFMVQRIAGTRADITVLLPPGAAPETYEPTAGLIAAAARARIYFLVGVPFERSGLRAIAATGLPGMRVVKTASPARDGAGQDPHTWMSPDAVSEMAGIIAQALAQDDPPDEPYFSRNLAAFRDELRELDAYIRGRLAGRRINTFIVAHASLGHFAGRYGLEQIALESGNREAGPRDLTDIISRARALGIRSVFVQPQVRLVSAQVVARELGARIIVIDPLAEDYLENMKAIADALSGALQ